MVTKHPKVSAYIPKDLFKKITKIKDDKNLTTSKTIIHLLKQYFRNKEEKEDAIKCSGRKLSHERFGLSPDAIAGRKRRSTPENFRQWIIKNDPDNVEWEFREYYYQAVGDLTEEVKARIKDWLNTD